jgi:arsenate reductase (thioredoxin)
MIKHVLFVDVQNSISSPMAAAWFNRHGGRSAKAASSGLVPAEWIDAHAIQAMYQVGIEIAHLVPKRLDPRVLEHADLVVSMGIELAVPESVQSQVWKINGPVKPSFAEVCRLRDHICRKVDSLIKELEQTSREDRFSDEQWRTAIANLRAM